MSARKKSRIVVKFTYSNGNTGGILDVTVPNHKIKEMRAAQDAWLSNRGHTLNSVTITPKTV